MNTPTYTNDELDRKLKVIFAAHQGRANAIKRWDLVVEVYGAGSDLPRTDANTGDREIRDGVERIRNHGWLILNLNDGRGRFLCTTEEEYREWRGVFLKQLKSIAGTVRSMDKFAKVKYPNLFQPSLFGGQVMDELLDSELMIGG